MRKILLFLVSFASFSTWAQIEEVRRITETLCSPEFHGRGYYQKGDSIAAEFLKQEFEKIGIKPYKKHDYFQSYLIDQVNTFPGKMDVVLGDKQLKPGVHFMIDPSSAGGQIELNPAILKGEKLVLGDGIDEGYLSSTLAQLQSGEKNAILLNTAHLSGDSLKKIRGFSEMLADIVPTIEVIDSKFTWSVGRKQLKFPLIYVQDSIYKSDETFKIEIEADLKENYSTQNVIAYLPGKKKCGKTVVFSAHYDHLGRMGDNTYFPGANDNASGTAMLISMAKYFKENPVDYNIMFIAFSGEEAGLLGSKFFVENPWLKLEKIRFVVNLDIMGSGEDGITAVNATLFENEFNLLNKINEEDQLLKKIKKRGPAANSDHYWFTEAGVPAFFIYTMGPNKNYHDVFDLYEELSFKEYDDITKLLVRFVEELPSK